MKASHRIAYAVLQRWWALTRSCTVGVRVVLHRDGEVLLVRHTYRRDWYLPGGGVDRGETLEQAARREVVEEVGARPSELVLHGAFTSFAEGRTDHVVVFHGRVDGEVGRMDREIEEARWFSLHDLPDGTSPATARRIGEFVEGGGPWHGVW